MSDKKTFRFSAEEEHMQYEKTKVQPTKVFNVEDLNLGNSNSKFKNLSIEDLEYKLEFEDLSDAEIEEIKAIIKSKK